MLTADDVLNSKFKATKFRDGYDQDDVDTFIDRVATALESPAGARPTAGPSAGPAVAHGTGTPAGMVDVGRRGFFDLFRPY